MSNQKGSGLLAPGYTWDPGRVILFLVLLALLGACLWFAVLPMLGINPAKLVANQAPTVPVGVPNTTAAPTNAPAPGQPAAPTVAPVAPGQPTSAAPTVKATVPAGPTTVTAAPTVAPVNCANCPNLQVGGVPYSPYSTWIGATLLGAKHGVNISYVDLGGFEENQPDWVSNKDPNQYGTSLGTNAGDPRFQKMPANTSRVLLTTTSTCLLTPGCKIPYFLGQSSGNDLIIVSQDVKTIDDALDVPIVGAAFGSVGEFFPKALAWSLVQRPVGQFAPQGDAGPAQDFFCKNPAYRVLSVYNPYASNALDPSKCGRSGNRVLISSKSFFGIKDIAMRINGVSYNANAMKSALQANQEFLVLVSTDPHAAWQMLADWAALSPDNATALGYDNYDDWISDMSGEAMFTGRDNVYAFGSAGQKAAAQDLADVKSILTTYPTFKRGNPVPVTPDPNLDPATILDDTAVLSLQKDVAYNAVITPPNHDVKLDQFGPIATGRKVLSPLPYLKITFKTGGSDFDNVNSDVDQLTKVTRALRLMKVNLQITANGDDLSMNRVDRVKSELKNNSTLRVPDGKIMTATNANLPVGTLSFALIGAEE